jgi:hypothetical protein
MVDAFLTSTPCHAAGFETNANLTSIRSGAGCPLPIRTLLRVRGIAGTEDRGQFPPSRAGPGEVPPGRG